MKREPDGLVARIRHMRRAFATPDVLSQLRPTSAGEPEPPRIEDLQARVAHLEQLVQGLQDSVYRESHRQAGLIAELDARLDPAALATALDKDARDRGL